MTHTLTRRPSSIKQYFEQLLSQNTGVYNLTGSSAALLLALEKSPFVAIEKDEARAEILKRDIDFYRELFPGGKTVFLPDSNGPAASGRRAEILYYLKAADSIVTSSKNLLTTLWNKKQLEANSLSIKKGDVADRSTLEGLLILLGYRQAEIVTEKGEYSRRGWITDIYPSTAEDPYRIEFFGDEIEHIRIFDVETQRSKEDVDGLFILPAAEPEDMLPLSTVAEGKKFYCLYQADKDESLPESAIFLSRYSFEPGHGSDDEGNAAETQVRHLDAGVLSMKGLGILPAERKTLEDIPEKIENLTAKNKVIIVASSIGQAERLRELFRGKNIIAPSIERKEISDFQGQISLTVGCLSAGIFLEGLIILTERELFGERPPVRPIMKSKVSKLLASLDEIAPGDFVVHREHGIGRFTGTVRQGTDEAELELMQIEYEDGRLYIPVQNIPMLSKYRAEEGIAPKTDKLGGSTWQRKKERARKKVHEIAEKLIALYAGRKVARGFIFSSDTELHREFDGFFPYQETPDQTKAIEEIKKDMESDQPMDRLICGDVGYGKTEVAMRAAFKAIYDNRQVAVLVPTTILAEQHFSTFRERFSGFPVTIDYISRFKSKKQINMTLKSLAKGEIDIIIGTHGLLSRKVLFNRLGLLIVDEEHKFGVSQKEKIKELSRDVDVLNLTATPIPRTLHMALSGIRDISIIETPPEERLSVKTDVTRFSDSLIRDAITRELERDGQVFFVHNRIGDIYRVADHLAQIVPAANIAVAHGQMPARELEKIMHMFFAGEVAVLVSTAIIGSGLDIARANTIIIDRADKMGLADLYQLRGRVGRSNLKGYGYFLIPEEPLMTEEAKKRLQAIQEMSYLGAGFRLAMKDLEIRGAGNVFGAEQSGHIHEIGLDLYIEMLEKAVAELQGIDIKEEFDPVIDLVVPAFIPDEYISDAILRLSFYRRISSLRAEKETSEFESELRDRFGAPPQEILNLLDIMRLKNLSRELMATKVQDAHGRVRVSFSPDTKVQPRQIFSLHDKRKGRVKYMPDGFELDIQGFSGKKAFDEIYGALKELGESVLHKTGKA
ncbi:MAG: transcription-repair coupling factor [Nitrospira bacterium HGW-Nitrospira-1]|nr:MAG: transcription-repair coupling factor [Nitrospira bacterium HGW-Nitrospira-1]